MIQHIIRPQIGLPQGNYFKHAIQDASTPLQAAGATQVEHDAQTWTRTLPLVDDYEIGQTAAHTTQNYSGLVELREAYRICNPVNKITEGLS